MVSVYWVSLVYGVVLTLCALCKHLKLLFVAPINRDRDWRSGTSFRLYPPVVSIQTSPR